jgi:peptide deformylase
MVLGIRKYGDPVLETPCAKVAGFGSQELKSLVFDMFETMYVNKGVGLAAPQVGVLQQVTVIDTSAGEVDEERLVLINPEIVEREGQQLGEEGCLSIPGFREDVRRAMTVKVRAFDVDGRAFEITGEELLARAMQHEIDHLHGILFLKHLSPLKRDLIRRKISKLVKVGEW